MKNKRTKIILIIIAIFIFATLLYSCFFHSGDGGTNASQEDFKKYIETYLFKYQQLVENNIPPESVSEFEFYQNYPYEVKGIFSTTHGAALFFNHSSISKITIDVIDDRIEFYMWPQMKKWWNNASTYLVMKENELVIFAEELGENPINVTQGARLEIYGTLIYENKMILKGCNDKKCWSEESAKIDALTDFLRVARQNILDEAEAKQVEGRTMLVLLAEKIAEREIAGYYRGNAELLAKDYKEYFDLAKEFDIETEIADNVLENVLEEYMVPPKSPWYHTWFIDSIIIPLIITIIGGWALLKLSKLPIIIKKREKYRDHIKRKKKISRK